MAPVLFHDVSETWYNNDGERDAGTIQGNRASTHSRFSDTVLQVPSKTSNHSVAGKKTTAAQEIKNIAEVEGHISAVQTPVLCSSTSTHWIVRTLEGLTDYLVLVTNEMTRRVKKNDAEVSIALCSLYLLFGIALLAMSFNLVQEEVINNVKSVAKRLGIVKDDEEDDGE
uniref:Uncharacterized protein n=1 Tax=Timema monikensis TaxID=170555 RepID=A0A7R9DYT9_9NEOP|nr:unnamed protein product [Timema monikensis]